MVLVEGTKTLLSPACSPPMARLVLHPLKQGPYNPVKCSVRSDRVPRFTYRATISTAPTAADCLWLVKTSKTGSRGYFRTVQWRRRPKLCGG